MSLDDRRLAMLKEMGVPFWRPLARTGLPDAAQESPAPAQTAAPGAWPQPR